MDLHFVKSSFSCPSRDTLKGTSNFFFYKASIKSHAK